MIQITRRCAVNGWKKSTVHLRLVIRAHARQVMGIWVERVRGRRVVGGIFVLKDRGQRAIRGR